MFRSCSHALAVIIMGLAGSSSTHAQDVEHFDDSPALVTDFDGLTLSQAIELALHNNLGARVERLQQDIASARVTGQRAEFDPVLSFSGLYESTEKPQNTREFVATQSALSPRTSRIFIEDNWRFDTSVKSRMPWGTEWEFTVELNELRNTLNIDRPPSLFYPEYETFAGFRFKQPLLRDFGPEAGLASLRVAQIERKIAEMAWRLKVMQTVGAVMKNYYDLVFASEDVKIKLENIQRARELQQQNRTRVEKGVGSEIDVQQAAVAASVREEELISAEYLRREKANLLVRDLVNDIDPVAVPRVHPFHRLSPLAPHMDRAEFMREATVNRIEYQQAKEQLARQDIRVRFAKNQLWPRLDLVGTFGANGLNRSSGSALGDAFDANYPAWSAGLVLTIPLGNRAAQAQLKETRVEKEQLLLAFKQLEIDMALQVDTAASRVETSLRRLGASRESVVNARATLEAEQKRLEEGVGVNFNLLEAQKDLSAAHTRELAARADLNKSLVDLWLTTGTLLERQHIVLEDSEAAPVAAVK